MFFGETTQNNGIYVVPVRSTNLHSLSYRFQFSDPIFAVDRGTSLCLTHSFALSFALKLKITKLDLKHLDALLYGMVHSAIRYLELFRREVASASDRCTWLSTGTKISDHNGTKIGDHNDLERRNGRYFVLF